MPLNYVVQAQVVDLRTDTPQTGESFLVDTNAWFWTTYSNAGIGLPHFLRYKLSDYPGYLRKCVAASANLHWCGLTLAELAHQIEKIEYEIWNTAAQAGGRPTCKAKEFRHNYSAERARIVREIQSVWKAVESLGSVLPSPVIVDAANTASALAEFAIIALDGYDLFFLQAARAANVTQIISDDGDFCGIAGIILFTSNQNVLAAARAQGKLLVR
jgi:hypothetical protein